MPLVLPVISMLSVLSMLSMLSVLPVISMLLKIKIWEMILLKYVDLNSDMGESFGHYSIGMDGDVLSLITSANVACGFHASDPVTMDRTVAMAAENGVHIGAHPGFHDLFGFGRRQMKVSPEELRCSIIYQVSALKGFCIAHGAKLHHVKPHGALYNMAVKDRTMADAIAEGVKETDPSLALLAPYGSCLQEAAEAAGIPFAAEAFADRAYMEDGSLVPRSQPGSMVTDPDAAARRVIRMVEEGKVTAITGKDIPVRADSICVHGDNPQALAFTKAIRTALEKEGIGIRAF